MNTLLLSIIKLPFTLSPLVFTGVRPQNLTAQLHLHDINPKAKTRAISLFVLIKIKTLSTTEGKNKTTIQFGQDFLFFFTTTHIRSMLKRLSYFQKS